MTKIVACWERMAGLARPIERWRCLLRRLWRAMVVGLAVPAVVLGAMAGQEAFREYPSVEYGVHMPLPPDWNKPAEFTFARLMFPGGPLDGYQARGAFTGPWQEGLSLWTQDYPRADRALANAVRRL